MAFAPVQLLSTTLEDYAGWWLKFYDQGTVNPLSMATDATGGTLLVKAEISSGGTVPIGFIKTAGNALLNPFVNGDYDGWLFPTEADADANDTTNAIRVADNLNTDRTLADLQSTDIDDGTKGYHLVFRPPLATEVGVTEYEYEYGDPRRHGAIGDWNGVSGTDNITAFQNVYASNDFVNIYDEAYFIDGQITKAADDIITIAYGARLIFDGAGGATGFSFGSVALDSLPNFSGLKWFGGTFENFDRTDVVDKTYLILSGMERFHISDVRLKDVSNGGVKITSGCRNGVIENIEIKSFSANTTLRGIWLNGADATDYAAQLVDLSAITRNATAVPVGAIRNVTIRNFVWDNGIYNGYGIYTHNAQDTIIEDCHLNVGAGTLRCITINTYSPRTIIRNNVLESSGANHGIYLTQFSHDCIIDGNTFTGNFQGGYPLNIIYLATARVTNNNFLTGNSIMIAVYMGGSGTISGNTFETDVPVGHDRCVRMWTIGSFEATQPGYGDTAGILNGLIFENNDVKTQNYGVQVTQQTSNTGANEAGIDSVIVRNNTFRNWADASGSQEYPLYIESIVAPANAIYYSAKDNICFPSTSIYLAKNRSEDPNAAGVDLVTTGQLSDEAEGDWTIDVTDNDAADEGQTYSINMGRWFRKGNIVTLRGRFTMSSLGALTTTHACQIYGLPFTAKNIANASWSMNIHEAGGLAITAGVALTMYVKANTKLIRVNRWSATTGTATFTLAQLTAAGTLAFSGSYEIEDRT